MSQKLFVVQHTESIEEEKNNSMKLNISSFESQNDSIKFSIKEVKEISISPQPKTIKESFLFINNDFSKDKVVNKINKKIKPKNSKISPGKLIMPYVSFKSINGILISEPKAPKFRDFCRCKRGRKSLGNKNSISKHSASDLDNVQRKLQVNYITFLINLANDIVISILGKKSKLHFVDIHHEIKKRIEYKYLEDMKNLTYSDILQMKVSPKFRGHHEDHNKLTLFKICELSEELKNFFSQNFLIVFQKYYFFGGNPLKEVLIGNIRVKLSPKTKNFFYLLLQNSNIKQNLINVIKDVYFNGINYTNNKPFKTVTNDSTLPKEEKK